MNTKIILIFLALLASVSSKPTLNIVRGFLRDLLYTNTSRTPPKQGCLPYAQNSLCTQNDYSHSGYVQGNNNNAYNQGQYPPMDYYYKPTDAYSELYPPSGSVNLGPNNYPPSGPAGVFSNQMFFQDPPYDNVNNHNDEETNSFQLDVRSDP